MAKTMKKPAKKKPAKKKPAKVVKKTPKQALKRRSDPARKPPPPLPPPPLALGVSGIVLDRLYAVVMSRRAADPAISHSARLLARGTAKVAQKFGEEAVECLIEAVGGDRAALIAESADVLYHILVLWVSSGVRPEEVWTELQRREGVSGIAEKASRNLPLAFGLQTTKIP